MDKQLEQKLTKSIDLLVSSLITDQENNRAFVLDNPLGLETILAEIREMLGEDINFYPSDKKGACHRIAYFTSFTGMEWNLKSSQKLTLKQMFEYLIKHCQGSCADITKYAIIVADSWDEDVVDFWKSNISRMKKSGIYIQVNIRNNRTTFCL